MKRTLCIVTLATLAGLLLLRAGGTAETRVADRKAIRAHIDSIFRAYIDGDLVTIKNTHTENWRGFTSRSRTIIRGIDEYMKGAEQVATSPRRLKGYEMIDYDTVFYGDVAVVSYIAEMDLGFESPFPFLLRVVDVYGKEKGEWIQLASNTSRHPDTVTALASLPFPVDEQLREEILTAREEIWRAYFEGRHEKLAELLPPETLGIDALGGTWKNREQTLAQAEAYLAGGGKLVSLDFPETEMQVYGDVAILYTTYATKFALGGSTHVLSGRGTEIFVYRDGEWLNSGWHLDTAPIAE